MFGIGGGLGIFKGEELRKGPKKKNLDEISIDKSIVLRAYDGHTMWLNSKEFKEFSIDIDTLYPIDGKI